MSDLRKEAAEDAGPLRPPCSGPERAGDGAILPEEDGAVISPLFMLTVIAGCLAIGLGILAGGINGAIGGSLGLASLILVCAGLRR